VGPKTGIEINTWVPLRDTYVKWLLCGLVSQLLDHLFWWERGSKLVEGPQEDRPVKLRTTLILPYPWHDFLKVCSQYV
jgi:hypothetical protein